MVRFKLPQGNTAGSPNEPQAQDPTSLRCIETLIRLLNWRSTDSEELA